MKPLITTITPYWNREDMLTVWLRSICANAIPEVHHLLFCVTGELPKWAKEYHSPSLRVVELCESSPRSIGAYHNLGAEMVGSEWIMKLDIDCIAHAEYFQSLLAVVEMAKPTEWFNGGMFYLERFAPLASGNLPVTLKDYQYLSTCRVKTQVIAGTNFICRRKTYLELGGCDPRFNGYGWEDYQQIYMLEAHQQQADPLPGLVELSNVTQRCRDQISRRKAAELFAMNDKLGLLHRWHPSVPKDGVLLQHNRKILFECITNWRTNADLHGRREIPHQIQEPPQER